jgi:hypothetical protein
MRSRGEAGEREENNRRTGRRWRRNRVGDIAEGCAVYEQEEYDENRWGTEGDNDDDGRKIMGRKKTEKERERKKKGR